MVFKLIVKGLKGPKRLGETEVSITKTSICFGAKILEELHGFVEVYLNEEANEVGFKATTNTVTGYKLKDRTIVVKPVSTSFQKGRYNATKVRTDKGALWVIKIEDAEDAED